MKKRNGYWLIAALCSVVLWMSVLSPFASKASAAFDVNAGAAILVDAETGQVLFEKNSSEQLGVASMSKMMTEYLLLEAVKEGTVRLEDTYEVSDYVYMLSQDRSLSNVPLRVGGTYTIQELYEAMTIYSANAATVAIAEKLAGSEAAFVEKMNAKAKELGLQSYAFVNTTGLNNKDLKGHHSVGGEADENTMSARDVALLAYHLVNDYPEVLETAGIPKKAFREGTDDEIAMENWNWMLPSLVFEYEGMTGLKTGTTDFAGYCFTGTAERDGRQLIGIVMNATNDNGQGTYNARFDEMKKLMNYGFGEFEEVEVVKAGSTVKGVESVAVDKGKEEQVGLVTSSAITILQPKQSKTNIEVSGILNSSDLSDDNILTAPVKKDKVVGFVELTAGNGETISYLEKSTQASLQTASSVEKANWFTLSVRAVGNGIGSGFNWVKETITGWF